MGHDLVIAHPPGYDLDEELIETLGPNVEITNDIDAAVTGADVIYAKSWGSKQFYGNADQDIATRAQYRSKWIVDEEKMSRTNNGIFMHCLPVRRNVIVTDGVIDSPASVVIDEAENRLHVQKAILARLPGG
jgi:N-acetylornithine carbamoyltransferase